MDLSANNIATMIPSPLHILTEIWRHRYLLGQLIKRDVLLRYRGAMFGVLWVFLSPLLMLTIFAYVFGQVFQARMTLAESTLPFWLLLYSGLIVFNIFADAVSRSPASVRGYPSFVKKIIFPLHILPLVPLGAALVHAFFNFLILIVALVWTGYFHFQVLFLPFLALPVVLLATGFSWFLGAWGVFIKDMSQIVPIFIQMLLFLSPVFYPVSAVPEMLRPFYRFNPLGHVIEISRALLSGLPFDGSVWGWAFLSSIAVAMLGFAFFQRSREEFADVL